MARRITSSSSSKRPLHTGAPLSLEDQLSSVVEQEGKLIVSPRGARKRRRSDSPSFFSASENLSSVPVAQDSVAMMDQKSVEFLLRPTGSTLLRKVKITHAEHVPSPYVLSVQKVSVQPIRHIADERISVAHATRMSHGLSGARSAEVYATISADLMSDSCEPHLISQQFTPDTFEKSYASVYGPFDGVRTVIHDVTSVVASWFQRVERVEQRVVEQTETALTVLEVPRLSLSRALAGFVVLALVVTLPANAIALYRSASLQENAASDVGNAAIGDLALAKDAASIPSSADALKKASSRFREADAMLSNASVLAIGLASVLPKTYRSARALLEIGDKSSDAGRLLAIGLDKVFADPTRGMDERLDVLGAYAGTALVLLSDASKAAATIDPSTIPLEKRAHVSKLLAELDQSTQAVREFVIFSDLLSAMVGKDRSRTYLLIFQNNTELRPTGGFMGSFAEVVMDQGKVKAVRVPPGGTYALKGQLLARIASPKPLQLINPLWQFQDSNWSPDFPTAAKKITWFWSKAGQPTLDGVIAVNASFVENVLALTGPIEMPEYGKTITAENFLLETQKAVEIEYDREANTPKKFIGDMAQKLMARLAALPQEEWFKIAGLVSSSLETKDIQIAMSDPAEEQVVERYGWSGRLKESAGDSLAIVEANIAGQKTDGMIKESVDHNVTVNDDGSMQTKLVLTRTHTAAKGELFRGVRNVSYVRFYVPNGSTLVSASGFQTPDEKLFKKVDEETGDDADILSIESKASTRPDGVTISEENGRTVFGGWLQLDPGASQTVTLNYQLPFTTADILARAEAAPQNASDAPRGAYLLLLSSQSGKSDREIHSNVTLPDDWKLSWSRRPGQSDTTGLNYSGLWDRDLVLAGVVTPPHGKISTQESTTAER